MALNIFDEPPAEHASKPASDPQASPSKSLRQSMLKAPNRPLDRDSILPHITNFEPAAAKYKLKKSTGRFSKVRPCLSLTFRCLSLTFH